MPSDVIFTIHAFHNDISWEKDSAQRTRHTHVREALPPYDFVQYDVWNETPFDVLWAAHTDPIRGKSGGNLGPINRPHAGKIHKLSDGEGDSNRPIGAALGTLTFTNQATGTTLELTFVSAVPK